MEAARVDERDASEPKVTRTDRESFDAFFLSEYRRVVALAVALCGRRNVAEEIAQDAFVAAFRHWSKISRYDDPAAWVRRVAANLATSSLRRRSREARALLRLSGRRGEVVEPTIEDTAFWNAVRKLPRRQAQCIALHYLEDLRYAEIATVLEIAEATVRVHVHAARRALATQLGEDAGEDPS